MNRLSNDLYLCLLSYWEVKEQILWCNCCKKWYEELLKGFIRKIRIHTYKWLSTERICQLLHQLPGKIKDFSRQLEIHLTLSDPLYNQIVLQLLEGISYPIAHLSCPIKELKYFLSQLTKSKVQLTTLDSDYFDHDYAVRVHESEFLEVIEQIPKLQELLVCMGGAEFFLPIMASLKTLQLRKNRCSQPIRPAFLPGLEKLSLHDCGITDVSMLDMIPDLTLDYCNNLTDISGLNNNRRITIESCYGIENYTKSFENSEIIQLFIPALSVAVVDMSRWQRVRSLRIGCSSHTVVEFINDNSIPRTVARCALLGMIASTTNLTITTPHNLRNLSLQRNLNITSLEGLGFERLAVIKLQHLINLISLKGIGIGRNKKVVVEHCPLIDDYYLLKSVLEVEVYCDHSISLQDFENVQKLTISSDELQVFPVSNQLQLLDISNVRLIKTFKGLEKIPSLILNKNHLHLLEKYLSAGGQLLNKSIQIYCNKELKKVKEHQIKLFHELWLFRSYLLVNEENNLTFVRVEI